MATTTRDRGRHWLVLAAAVLAVNGPPSRATTGTTFDVRDYGAKADGRTDDVRAVQACVDAAAKAGPGNTVRLPAGRYLLKGPGVDPAFYVRLPRGAVGLTVAGEAGTVLLTAGGRGPFLADGCSACCVRDFTVDFASPNVCQGTVTAADPDPHTPTGTLTVRMDAGSPPPDAADFRAAGPYAPKLNVLTPGRPTFDWTRQTALTAVRRVGDAWALTVDRRPAADDVGRRFFVWGRQQGEWKPLVDLRAVRDGFTIDRVEDYAGGGFAGGGESGVIRVRRFYCGPPPGTDWLGFYGGHQGHSRADVEITDSQWLMSNDDDMNALTPLRNVLAQPAPDTIAVADANDDRPGDTVQLWDYGDVNAIHARETAVVRRVDRPKDGPPRLVLDHAVTVARPGPPGDARPNDDPHDRVVNLSSGGKITLRNCSFSASFAHPLLLKSARGIDIQGCRIFGSDMSGLDCGMQSFWNEGPPACDVVVKDNVFYDIDGISCRIGIEVPHGTSSASRDQRNVTIERNVFLAGGRHAVWNGNMPRGTAVLVGNVSGATVGDNLFDGFPNANVAVYASQDVTVAGNVFLSPQTSAGESNQWKDSARVDAQSLVCVRNADRVVAAGNVAADVKRPKGPLVVSDRSGHSDNGIARMTAVTIGVPPGGREAVFDVPDAGVYAVVLTYENATLDADRHGTAVTGRLTTDGDPATAVDVRFPFTADWGRSDATFKTMARLPLHRGPNRVRLEAAGGTVELHAMTAVRLPDAGRNGNAAKRPGPWPTERP